MDKAYSLEALADRLKDQGLELAEDSVVMVVEELFQWVVDSAPLSATPIDDIAIVVLPHLKKLILDQVDKIDGEQG